MHHGQKIYIHRDISPNNILEFEGRGRLADLEYVKEYQAESSHNIRTVESLHAHLDRDLIHSSAGND